VELERSARAALLAYLAAKDGGRAPEAYSRYAAGLKSQQSFSDFSAALISFNAKAGAVIERRIVTVTWTKDPAQAPAPGVYAAIDLISRFANVDRDCGYVVLYQPPGGGDFSVAREEVNFIDNATAKSMTPSQLDNAWSQLTARCPNYPAATPVSVEAPLPEDANADVGYPTVNAALAGLHARSGVEFSTNNGWIVATDKATATIWSFPPPGNPAYPSAVKRQIVSDPRGGSSIEMTVHCEATKQACDDLVRSFEQLNAQMKAYIHGQ